MASFPQYIYIYIYQNNRSNENGKEEIKMEGGKRTVLYYIYVVQRYYICVRNEIS